MNVSQNSPNIDTSREHVYADDIPETASFPEQENDPFWEMEFEEALAVAEWNVAHGKVLTMEEVEREFPSAIQFVGDPFVYSDPNASPYVVLHRSDPDEGED